MDIPLQSPDEHSPPDVSVVIPCFNNTTTLFRAIDEVFAQSSENWEIIVVDDGSTPPIDKPDDWRGNDVRLRWMRHDSNKGVSAARNTGVAAAKGAFVAFLDSDDEWMPNKLERQLAISRLLMDPRKALCLTKTVVRSHGGLVRIRPERRKLTAERFDEYLFVQGGFAQTSSFFLGKDLADSVQFRSNLRQYEDHLYLMDAEAAGAEYAFIDEPLTIYNDEKTVGRLSTQADQAQAFAFLREASDSLSPKAKLAFQIRYMAHSLMRERPMASLGLIMKAFIGGVLRPRYLLSLLLRGILPASFFSWIKNSTVMSRRSE